MSGEAEDFKTGDLAVLEIRRVASVLGYTEDALLEELRDSIIARILVLLRVEDYASESQLNNYLRMLLDREATVEELEFSRENVRRRLRLSEDERILLERRQNDRCAICGTFLDQAASPHVDHVRPITQGGADSLKNLQILCSKCNLGKGDIVAWHLAVPYQFSGEGPRIRYAVLARARGRCSEAECDVTVTTSQLKLLTRIPSSAGGRKVFDNLRVVCDEHYERIAIERRRRTKRALKRESRGNTRRIVSG